MADFLEISVPVLEFDEVMGGKIAELFEKINGIIFEKDHVDLSHL